MRIDRLTLRNFKKFEELTLDLHPRFTVLVGENGSGKTTLLDALAVSLGIWLVRPPDSSLASSGRNILPTEIRLIPSYEGDRTQFREARPVFVQATGQIGDQRTGWIRRPEAETETGTFSRGETVEALQLIRTIYGRDAAGEAVLCPVLAYYGAGRAWLSSGQSMPPEAKSNGPARRWAAFHDCFNERIRFDELRKWFHRETTAAGNRGGRMRPGFLAVRQAVLGCVPEADGLWFDPDREQIVLSIDGEPQPFENLSAGQRMMLALVADIAIKAVTQNAHLLPPDELTPEDEPLARLFQKTPGVVLIDELDVHLHPRWQRRVPADLKRTFPGIQFVCTSHSPQVIGEVTRDEVRLLRPDGLTPPPVAQGADSNWILDHVMGGALSETPSARRLKDAVETALEEGDLRAAHEGLTALRRLLDGETGDLVRLESSLYALEALAEGGDTREDD